MRRGFCQTGETVTAVGGPGQLDGNLFRFTAPGNPALDFDGASKVSQEIHMSGEQYSALQEIQARLIWEDKRRRLQQERGCKLMKIKKGALQCETARLKEMQEEANQHTRALHEAAQLD